MEKEYKKIYLMSEVEKKAQNKGEFWVALIGLLAILEFMF
jgi:hypothetical protein